MIKSIIDIGVKTSMGDDLVRKTKTTNLLILLLLGFTLIVFFPVLFEDGFGIVAIIDIINFLFLGAFMWINYKGYNKAVRVILSVYSPIVIMIASIAAKISERDTVAVFDFFDGRVLIAGFCIIPFILFSYPERKTLFAVLALPFFFSAAFDPIHTLFGVGYTDFFGEMSKQYIVTGIYIDIVLIFVAAAIYSLIKNIDSLAQKNKVLIDDLGESNMDLSELFEEQEELNKILKNNEHVIQSQKQELLGANKQLSEEISDKSIELKQSNDELIKHNNDLQQFSNTLSHNLRGPVANLLGLANLFKIDKSEGSRLGIAEHIHKSAETLDGVIKDLNKIVELRNNLFQIKEKIFIKKELQDIWHVLESSVEHCNAKLELNITSPVTYGVRSYFHSILYNLISNAIKYRHPDRNCLIIISSDNKNGECNISVEDNGVGIDLEKHGDKVFGMYKRFHTHLEGKGLGLFITKQQIESMGGKIDIKSELNVGTKFSIRFPAVDPLEMENQLFYGSDVANIYLDVVHLITILVWKRMPSPDEFKDVFTNNIEVFSSYNSDKWIIKLVLLGNMPEMEKRWIIDNSIDTYANVGVKTIVVIRDQEDSNQEFWNEFASLTAQKPLDVFFVHTLEEAKEKLINM